MPRPRIGLESIQAFEALPAQSLAEIAQYLRKRLITRGEFLVRQGEQADALFIVVSGRFRVEIAGQDGDIAEIGAGSPIGEIAFFTGAARTASVRAARDSVVLQLGRDEFETLSAKIPALWSSITASLARRLAHASLTLKPRERSRPNCIALCPAGSVPIPQQFMQRFRRILADFSKNILLLEQDDVPNEIVRQIETGSESGTTWFNELESKYSLIIYICGPYLNAWCEKVIRQADEVLLVASHNKMTANWQMPLNAVECFARDIHPPHEHRLVLVHPAHSTIAGTANWFDTRPVRIHHHLAIRQPQDYERLLRFLSGSAIGFVACGGGALCATHIGVYQALLETGIPIDMVGGTSGGGAMTAAFAMGASPRQVDDALEDIFVRSKALKRMTWPRYSLLDHGEFDRALARHYTEIDIVDLWLPYFALSSNLTSNQPYIHRRGQLWEAVRATGSIPGLLPPCYTDAGEMLVDGGVLDNVPVAAIRDLKWGPNIVVNLSINRRQRYDVDYSAIPTRNQMLTYPFRWLTGKSFPAAPGPTTVLLQSLAAHRPRLELYMTDDDLLLAPPIPSHMGMMDWSKHSELMLRGYEYATKELARARTAGHSLFRHGSL